MPKNSPSTIAPWHPFADLEIFPRWSRLGTLPAIRSLRDHVDAVFSDGVLTIEIGKREEAKPKTIAFK